MAEESEERREVKALDLSRRDDLVRLRRVTLLLVFFLLVERKTEFQVARRFWAHPPLHLERYAVD